MGLIVPRPGKRVGGDTYLHKAAVDGAEPVLAERVAHARALAPDEQWNVAKVGAQAVSLLLYENFDEVAFPALLHSARIDLKAGAVVRIDYRGRDNPPILHRKEMMLLGSDPRRPAFAALTRVAEEAGLFVQPHRIGNRRAWLERVAEAGLEIRGPRLMPRVAEHVGIERHRTAIARRELSQPMQLLVGNGIVSEGRTVFDYGCGQGDDVAALAGNGFEAFGWDPHHAPNGLRREADVVNLGFVLNVIEDRHERAETLRAAWSFARRALAVSAMTFGKVNLAGQRPYLDGHLTSRGTFQKYYGQQELRDYLIAVLGEEPLALGPGVFSVFRDKDLEQEVLLRKRSRRFAHSTMRPPARERATAIRPGVAERCGEELDALRIAMLGRGRPLANEEFPLGLRLALHSKGVSTARATAMCLSDLFDQGEMAAASFARSEDMLVHLALTLFPGAPKYTTLSKSIQLDVRAFFGGHAKALERARGLLFSAGDANILARATEDALALESVAARGSGSLRLRAEALPDLPPVLRVLVGCAGVLCGGEADADYIDIKPGLKRVSFLSCRDPAARLPLITERTKVDLARLRSRTDRPDGLVVYLKSRFMPLTNPAREAQEQFDRELLKSEVVSKEGRGPHLKELREAQKKLKRQS